NPYSYYEISYRLYVIKIGDIKFAYVIFPFFEYISITRYKDSKYRNCLFKYKGYKYSYSKATDNPDLPSSKFAAYRSSSLLDIPPSIIRIRKLFLVSLFI